MRWPPEPVGGLDGLAHPQVARHADIFPTKQEQGALHGPRADGVTYGHDLIIDRGKMAALRKFRGAYGPLRSRPRRTSRGAAADW
jgi:hypothetical protein